MPQPALLDPAYAATRRCLIHDQALASPVAPGRPVPALQRLPSRTPGASRHERGQHTNHIVTADKWGNVVSYTNTIKHFAGSGDTVPGYGFLLNNEMTDFDFAPPAPGPTTRTCPPAGKRPRSSMGPAIVLRHGQPDFAVGAAGGSTIITTILQIILNHVDFGMSLPAALAAPRVSQRNSATSLAEPAFYNSALAQQLTSQFGEQFTAGHRAGTAAGPLSGRRDRAARSSATGAIEAVAEPVRLYGGSALVVHPSR